jgi:hypothetical protein
LKTFPRRVPTLVIAIGSTLLLLVAAGVTAWASSLADEGGWAPPSEVSQSGSSTSRGPSLLLEGDGTLHAIWMEQAWSGGTPYFTIYPAKSTDRGRNWSHTIPLTPAGTDGFEAAADMDQYGGQHLVWHEAPGEHQVWYGQLRDTGWEERVMISTTESVTPNIFGPDIEVAGDWIHTIWSEQNYGPGGSNPFDVYYSRSEGGEVWSPASLAAATGRTSLQLTIAADQHENLHVVWWENSTPRSILYISGTVYATDTVWSAPITVSLSLSQSAATPNIAVGSDDVVHVVFGVDVENQQHFQDVYHARFPVSDTDNISPTLIPGSRVDISQLLPTYASPAIALVGTSSVHVAWNGMKEGDYYADRIYYAVSDDGGTTWSDPVPATPRDSWPDGFPSLAIDDQFVYLLYQQKVTTADQDIYYTKRFPVRRSFPLGLKAY